MKIVVLGFFLLLTLMLLAYWQGAVADASAFGTAITNAAKTLTGRDAAGNFVGYPSGTSPAPPAGGGSSGGPGGCKMGGTDGCPCGQYKDQLLGMCLPCVNVFGACV